MAVAGLLIAGAQILSLLAFNSDGASTQGPSSLAAFCYFSFAIFVMVLCQTSFMLLVRTPFYSHYAKDYTNDRDTASNLDSINPNDITGNGPNNGSSDTLFATSDNIERQPPLQRPTSRPWSAKTRGASAERNIQAQRNLLATTTTRLHPNGTHSTSLVIESKPWELLRPYLILMAVNMAVTLSLFPSLTTLIKSTRSISNGKGEPVSRIYSGTHHIIIVHLCLFNARFSGYSVAFGIHK